MTGRLPRWLRVLLVAAVAVLASGAGLFAYRYMTRPVTWTVAVGSIDGEVARVMSAIASRLAAADSPVRLKILDTGTVLEATKAFAEGKADLVVARDDIGNLSAGRTVLLVTHGVVLIVVPPGSPIDSMDGLKGKTVGVVGGEVNHRVVQALVKEYDLVEAKVRFKDLTPADIQQALKDKQVQALLFVIPISARYLTKVRDFFPRNAKQKPAVIPIDSAGAIAAVARSFESYDLPKGTISGSPPVPDEDLTTLRVPVYLIANAKLDRDLVTSLTKAIIDTRRDLVGDYPLLAQMSAPSTDKDAFIPIHPGAAAYFDGEQKTFFDKYGDTFFYGSMLLGSLASIFVAAWKFMLGDAEKDKRPATRLYGLTDRIANAGSEADLADIEQSIDGLLKEELARSASGESDAAEAAALSLATHRLEYLINRRRATLEAAQS